MLSNYLVVRHFVVANSFSMF